MTFEGNPAEVAGTSSQPEAAVPTAAPSTGGDMPPATPDLGWTPSPSRRGGSGKRLGLGLAALAGLGVIGAKLFLTFVVAGVAGQVLGAAFGGPFERLSSDDRSGLEKRVDAALGSKLDGLSKSQQQARVMQMVQSGYLRLDDATLVTRFRILSQAIDKSDAASCAAFGRADFSGARPSEEVSNKLLGGLDDTSLRQWYDIAVQSLEAEASGTPAARTVNSSEAESAIGTTLRSLPPADLATVQSMSAGTEIADEAVCSAERSLDRVTLTLGSADLNVFVRYIVSP